jgi:hypothetical protein
MHAQIVVSHSSGSAQVRKREYTNTWMYAESITYVVADIADNLSLLLTSRNL